MFPVLFMFSAQLRADCLDWEGITSSSHPILTQTKHVSLSVEEAVTLGIGEQECIDTSTCVWSLNSTVGTLDQESGVDNTYTAPATLSNCEPQSVVLILECLNENGDDFEDSAEVTIACDDEIDDSNPSYWTASGGGCNSPSALFIPLLLCFRRKKTR